MARKALGPYAQQQVLGLWITVVLFGLFAAWFLVPLGLAGWVLLAVLMFGLLGGAARREQRVRDARERARHLHGEPGAPPAR